MRLRPCDVRIDSGGMLVGTLGHAEAEFAAAMIVHWHQVQGLEDWVPVSRRDLAGLLTVDTVIAEWARNPFWRPRPYELHSGGFIEGWTEDPNVKGTVTDKFLEALGRRFRPSAVAT